VGSLVILAMSVMMVAMPVVLGMVSVIITVSRMFSVSILILFFHNIPLTLVYYHCLPRHSPEIRVFITRLSGFLQVSYHHIVAQYLYATIITGHANRWAVTALERHTTRIDRNRRTAYSGLVEPYWVMNQNPGGIQWKSRIIAVTWKWS
jgi:uncharacterized membrane-anchored protein YitT (DUF2179 family)